MADKKPGPMIIQMQVIVGKKGDIIFVGIGKDEIVGLTDDFPTGRGIENRLRKFFETLPDIWDEEDVSKEEFTQMLSELNLKIAKTNGQTILSIEPGFIGDELGEIFPLDEE